MNRILVVGDVDTHSFVDEAFKEYNGYRCGVASVNLSMTIESVPLNIKVFECTSQEYISPCIKPIVAAFILVNENHSASVPEWREYLTRQLKLTDIFPCPILLIQKLSSDNILKSCLIYEPCHYPKWILLREGSVLDCWKEMGQLIRRIRTDEKERGTLLPTPSVNLDETIKLQLVPKEPIKSFADYIEFIRMNKFDKHEFHVDFHMKIILSKDYEELRNDIKRIPYASFLVMFICNLLVDGSVTPISEKIEIIERKVLEVGIDSLTFKS